MNIQELHLKSKNIRGIEHFYKNILGFKNLESFEKKTSFQIGESKLIFEYDANATPYHFAFNIASNKIDEAKLFLSSKLNLLSNEEGSLFNFESWNAQAIYFHDKDKNIVEFIARKNLINSSNNDFDSNSVLNISEIGIPTQNVKEKHAFLNSNLGLEKYSGDYETFCASGDENGLFIIIDKNNRKWFPQNEEAFSSEFKLIGKQNDTQFQLEYQNDELKM